MLRSEYYFVHTSPQTGGKYAELLRVYHIVVCM